MDLENERGVFNLVLFRKILDKLIYQDNFSQIEANMSESNIGARKERNVRDHLFVVHGIVNDIVHKKEKSADMLIYDIRKCFDHMWFCEAMNCLYDTKLNNDQYYILCETNKLSKIAVKTPVGVTKRFDVPEVVLQGGNWGPLQCSVKIDKIGKECFQTGENLYQYKDCIDVSPLAMIDDVAAPAKCGTDSVLVHNFIKNQNKVQQTPVWSN